MISGPEDIPTHTPRRRLEIRFPLGRLGITPQAQEFVLENNVPLGEYLSRHVRCDWGDVDDEDWAANDRALTEGTRLFSAYEIPDCTPRIWIITEADRSSTTVLMPSDY